MSAFQVAESLRSGSHRGGFILTAEAVQAVHTEMALELLGRRSEFVCDLRDRHRYAHSFADESQSCFVISQLGAKQKLCRLQSHYFFHCRQQRGINCGVPWFRQQGVIRTRTGSLRKRVNLGDHKITCRGIHRCYTVCAFKSKKRHEKIVATVTYEVVFEHGACGDHTSDLSAHQSPGLFRVFHLFTDGRTIALLYQCLQISVNCVVGYTTHGDAPLVAHLPAGERQL